MWGGLAFCHRKSSFSGLCTHIRAGEGSVKGAPEAWRYLKRDLCGSEPPQVTTPLPWPSEKWRKIYLDGYLWPFYQTKPILTPCTPYEMLRLEKLAVLSFTQARASLARRMSIQMRRREDGPIPANPLGLRPPAWEWRSTARRPPERWRAFCSIPRQAPFPREDAFQAWKGLGMGPGGRMDRPIAGMTCPTIRARARLDTKTQRGTRRGSRRRRRALRPRSRR